MLKKCFAHNAVYNKTDHLLTDNFRSICHLKCSQADIDKIFDRMKDSGKFSVLF